MTKTQYERPVITKINTGMSNKFGVRVKTDAFTHIENISVKYLLETYGSPLYVISERTIRETFSEAKRAFQTRYPKVQFAWSYKTNYLDAVCKIFHQEGSWAEVVSGFEYEKALRNGVDGKQIIFNGPSKSVEDLEKAIKNDSLIHVDHFDELYTIFELAEKSENKPKIAIRVNMNTGIYPMWDRFGFNYENGEAWNAINRIMLNNKIELVGLHTHIGTYIMVSSAYAVAVAKLADLALGLEQKFKHYIKYIDLGGGFASKNTLKGAYLQGTDTCPSFDEYAQATTDALINAGLNVEHLPMLILESGRALIDDSGYLLGTVLANKRLADGRKAMIIDIGLNLLFTSLWYDHKIEPAQPFSQQTEETTIYGPLCMNIDVIRESVKFPILKKGDNVVISRIGAYNMTQWLQFIKMRPAIVLIDEKEKIHLIREKETLETIVSNEKVPEHLTKI